MYTVFVVALALLVAPLGLWLSHAGFGGLAMLALWGGTIALGLVGLVAKFICQLRNNLLNQSATAARRLSAGRLDLSANRH